MRYWWLRDFPWARLTILGLFGCVVQCSSRPTGQVAFVASPAASHEEREAAPATDPDAGIAAAPASLDTGARLAGTITPAPEDVASPFGSKPPSSLHSKLDEIGAIAKSGRFDEARQKLRTKLPGIDGVGKLDERVVAHVLLARIERELNAEDVAGQHYRHVREMWSDPARAVQSVGGPDELESARSARVVRALNGVGEAIFYGAEEESRKRLRSLSLLPRRGQPQLTTASGMAGGPPAPSDGVWSGERRKSGEKPFREWLIGRQHAVEAVERSCGEVFALEPAAPPKWAVSSLARVGQLWSDFADDYEQVTHAAFEGAVDAEAHQIYSGRVGAVSDPRRQRATRAFEQCRHTAERYRISDEFSELCLQALRAHP